MFPLTILAEWFAARDLETRTPAADEMAAHAERLRKLESAICDVCVRVE